MGRSLSETWRRAAGDGEHVGGAVSLLPTWLQRLVAPQGTAQRARTGHARAPVAELPAKRQPASLPGRWGPHRLRLAPGPGELVAHLDYWLYEPARRHGAPLPLVIMLHGCGQSPQDFAAGTQMNALAEREGFFVAYAEQPARRQLHRCWQWFDLAVSEGGREVRAVAALIDALRARRDIDPHQVYLAGLSAGAAMAAVVAMRHPERIAAVGLHSGVVIGAADSARAGLKAMRYGSTLAPDALLHAAGIAPSLPVPALILHGLDDEVVHPRNARLLARQFLAYNRLPDSLEPVDFATGDDEGAHSAPGRLDAQHAPVRCATRDIVQLCEIAGLGHAWSGGDPAFRYHSATGPRASALMWAFFRQHRR